MCNKNFKKSCTSKFCSPDFALLILRVALGIVFFAHGLQKVQNMDATLGFFASFGIPAFLAYLVAWIELLGGIALILGVFTCIAGALIAIIMVFAVILVKSKAGGLMAAELDFMAFASAIAISVMGPGRFSLLKGKCCPIEKCHGAMCGTDTCGSTCGDKCCTDGTCTCGDCESCKVSDNKCSHDSGCTCGDCGMCK